MMTYLIFYSMMLSMMFLFLNHPLSFGLILLLQTMLIALMTGLMSLNYWFSYILFLIMIGGMLILFIYMTSIASNEKFKFSYKLTMMSLIFIMMICMFLILDSYFTQLNLIMMDLINQNLMINYKMSMYKFLNWNLINNLYMIIIYLLITLIMVVNITKVQFGPLRQKF